MIRGTRFVPFAFVLEIRDHKWVVLQAAILGFAVFELLGLCARFVASVMDRMLFTSVTSSVREVLLQYRVWELYRALLYCMAAASAGWIVARVYRSRRTLAVASVVFVLGVSLLISLFTGPGYYLRDFVLIASITLSPLIGGAWFRRRVNLMSD